MRDTGPGDSVESMISVLLVDDHHAVRAGLRSLLQLEPAINTIADAPTAAVGLALARKAKPRVAIVDYHLPDGDGIELCRQLRREPAPPEVVIFSAFAGPELALAAALVGAHSMLPKESSPATLCAAVTAAARGTGRVRVEPALLGEASRDIDLDDLPVLGMLADGTSIEEIATVLGLEPSEVEIRAVRIVDQLKQRAAAFA